MGFRIATQLCDAVFGHSGKKGRLQEPEPMTFRDSFVIGDLVGQHAGKSKVNSRHIGESASRRCKAARLGTGYALEFATAGQGHCHCLPPACNRFHNGARVIVTRLGADCLVKGCVRIANRARPPSGLHQHLNSFSPDAQLRFQREVAQIAQSIQPCHHKDHGLWPILSPARSCQLDVEIQRHLHEFRYWELSPPSPE